MYFGGFLVLGNEAQSSARGAELFASADPFSWERPHHIRGL